jgi:hypothetical protein
MIRRVELQDAKAITAIYNEYVAHSVVIFDIEPVREEDMRFRIAEISAHYPYFVYESDGKVMGYCYAHPWKQRVRTYIGNDCLSSSRLCRERYGNPTHDTLDRRMSEGGVSCTDCLSDGAE